MADHNDGSELAQKYQEKIEARKRGAGTHQSKFRGFSLTKSSDKTKSTATTDANDESKEAAASLRSESTAKTTRTRSSTSMSTAAATNITSGATRSRTIQAEVETTVQSMTTLSVSQMTAVDIVPAGGDASAENAAGLNEKYQERIKARFRGAGAHQPDFRGFTIKTKKADKAAAPTTETEEDSEPSNRRRSLRRAVNAAAAEILATNETRQQKPLQEQREEVEEMQESRPQPTAARSRLGISNNISRKKATQDTRTTLSTSSRPTETDASATTAPKPSLTNNSERSALAPASARNSQPRPRPASKAHQKAAQTPVAALATVQPSPGNSRTRSASRNSGFSPNFKIAWGKNTTLLTSESSAPRSAPIPDDQVFDDPGDYGGMNDDQGYEATPPPPSPPVAREVVDVDNDSDLHDFQPERRHGTAKRKSPILEQAQAGPPSPRRPVATATTKRRRMIQEEADENEDPHLAVDMNQLAKSVNRKPSKERAVRSDKQSLEKPNSKKEPSKVSRTSKSASVAKPLKQTTLLQLTGTAKARPNSQDTGRAAVVEVDSGSESDFARNMMQRSRTSTSRSASTSKVKSASKGKSTKKGAATGRKGPSDKTIKTYKQLQIHCLKFLGPSTAVSRPAVVSNQAVARQLPVEGELPAAGGSGESSGAGAEGAAVVEPVSARKSVQATLQIDHAPLSEMDVIAEAVRGVVDTFIDSMEDQAMAKDMLTLRSDLETLLIEQVDILDDYTLLRASVKKAAGLKKELRVRLLETRQRRQRTREELTRVRANFEREERARHRLEETHKFLTDLEALRDEVAGSEGDDDDDDDDAGGGDELASSGDGSIKTGLQSLIATVGARTSGQSRVRSNRSLLDEHAKAVPSGLLGTLQEFNRILEQAEETVMAMPLVSHSQIPSTVYSSSSSSSPLSNGGVLEGRVKGGSSGGLYNDDSDY